MSVVTRGELIQQECHPIKTYVDDDGDLGLTQSNGNGLDYILLGREQMGQLYVLLGELLHERQT